MKLYKCPSVLTIAGFDSSGGAGIQADIKTISSLGCYASSVLTALPIQNTWGVRNIYPISLSAVREQIEVVVEDIPPDVIKIGMVHTAELVQCIVDTLANYPPIPIVFDPVMVATSGDMLMQAECVEAMKAILFPRASLITPNMDEAAILAAMSVVTEEDMLVAGPQIRKFGTPHVLLKGGHLAKKMLTSYLFYADKEPDLFETPKIKTNNVHGSGCTLSSAIACYMAQGYAIRDAVAAAQDYVFNCIVAAQDLHIGGGNGPLNHFSEPQKMIKYEMV